MTSSRIAGRLPANGQSVVVEVTDGFVSDIRPDGSETSLWLSPGLIDLQVNGFGGFDVNGADASPDDIVAMVHALFARGTTTVVPTVITASESSILAALRRIVDARASDPLVRHAIPYVHVEGPHLSPNDGPRGVHPLEHIRPPSFEEFQRWQAACDGLIGIITLSPHSDEFFPYVSKVARTGVHVSIGHTHATPSQITSAVLAGATMSTHLGNGADAVLARHPNYLWTQLADDRLTAGFIADGHHLSDDTLIAMLRAKGLSRSILVSDSTALAGLEPGRYRTPVGGEVSLSQHGRLSHVGTPYLAGAARPLIDGVAHIASLGPFTLAHALGLATSSPGHFIGPAGGFAGPRGILRVGAPADLVTFTWPPGDRTLSLQQVLASGTTITPAPSPS